MSIEPNAVDFIFPHPVIVNRIGGKHYFRTVASWTPEYQAEIWDNIPCDGCDPVATGTPIEVPEDGMDGIDFVLGYLPGTPCAVDQVVMKSSFEASEPDYWCKVLLVNAGEGGYVAYGSDEKCLEARECQFETDRQETRHITFEAIPRRGSGGSNLDAPILRE